MDTSPNTSTTTTAPMESKKWSAKNPAGMKLNISPQAKSHLPPFAGFIVGTLRTVYSLPFEVQV